MTQKQYDLKKDELKYRRKMLKYNIVHDDSAVRINHLKELIESLENEIKAYENK